MAHHRTAIRQAVVSTVTGLVTTGSNVFRSKVYNVDPSQMPLLVVQTNDDFVENYTMSFPRTQKRQLTITIQAVVRGSEDVDITLDNVLAEVEVAMGNNHSLDDTAVNTSLQNTNIDYSGDGDKPYAIGVLTYLCRYSVLENQPGG